MYILKYLTCLPAQRPASGFALTFRAVVARRLIGFFDPIEVIQMIKTIDSFSEGRHYECMLTLGRAVRGPGGHVAFVGCPRRTTNCLIICANYD